MLTLITTLLQGGETALERHTQTLNWAPKHKEAMAAPPPTKDAAASVLPWEIYDAAATQVCMYANAV